MSDLPGREFLQSAFDVVLSHLLSQMRPEGYWEGGLSSSALSTATALSALSLAGIDSDADLIRAGVNWLAETQRVDGGWGDTPDSPSNLSTTLLAACALSLAKPVASSEDASQRAQDYIRGRAGIGSAQIADAVRQVYGADHTFAVPILMNCALAGLVSWRDVPALPFELAVFPRGLYKALRLQVVSYALPALIAVGLNINHHNPPRNPLARTVRRFAKSSVLDKLATLQPSNGGFLEATPLTCFVAMSLVPVCGAGHSVIGKCLEFARASQRADGSWPIDTNLSAWVTTGAVAALSASGTLDRINPTRTAEWIAAHQCRETHVFTGAAPGGWGWTHLPGGVPDADDTAGAVLALSALGSSTAVPDGVKWLLDLQNTDGGWPTFCRGWGKLPFDKSSPDITAHALRALRRVDPNMADSAVARAVRQGIGYLSRSQRPDGAWVPLWFGNQAVSDASNPVFGASRVLPALADWCPDSPEAAKGVSYLIDAQNTDGGWGGNRGIASCVEETALAVIALTRFIDSPDAGHAVARGTQYLIECVKQDTWRTPSPIGLYFASLWYSEDLYPVVWTLEALGRVLQLINETDPANKSS